MGIMEMGIQNLKQKADHIGTASADQDLEIYLYTDPLCCWSWAAKPHLDKLRADLSGRVSWNIVMGGLLPDWLNFNDQTSLITRPVQMGPVWMYAGQLAGKPIQHQLWLMDPPTSSYPACIAVKCAGLQSDVLAEYYLDIIRDACMLRGINISKVPHLFELAEQMSLAHPSFNLHLFRDDFENGNAIEAFRQDLELVRYADIDRFPTLIIKYKGKEMRIPGYRKYEEIVIALRTLAPGLL